MVLPRRVVPRRRGILRLGTVLAVVAIVGVVSACRSGGALWQSGSTPGATSSAPEANQLSVTPAANARDFSPADTVTVTIATGTLDKVSLTNSEGRAVKGEFDDAKTSWHSAEELGYNKRYTLASMGTGADGMHYQDTRSFTTVKPNNYTLPYLRANVGTLLDGGTYGVGQPVVIWFDESIPDRAAAQRALTVTTDPVVEGAWHWMDSHEVHWRPKEYWPPGTKVVVDAKVYGRNLGGGLYGQQDVSASFTIGPSKIAIADSVTHHMKVYINGEQVTTINGKDVTAGIPISMGKTGTERGVNGEIIDFRTNSGPHVITLKYEVYHMTSASFGITDKSSPNFYDVMIKKSIRISESGEFVHLADWNIPQQGHVNTSHGCINVAPTYIYWFYNTFGAGDVVDVRNTGKQLNVRDGLGDWVLSWDDWVKGSAI
jgi:lipoprotein-anchoring transpeptidase ErfK/SrfK